MQLQNAARLVALTIGVVLLVILISSYNFGGAIRALVQLKSVYFLTAILAFIAYTLLRYLPWAYIMRRVRIRMGILHSFLMMQAYFNLAMLPLIYQFISLKHLSRFKKNAHLFSGSIIISTGLTGFLGLVFMALFASFFVSVFIPYVIALAIVLYLSMSFLGRDRFVGRVISFIRSLNRRFKSKLIHAGLGYLENIRKTGAFLSQKDILVETASYFPLLICENLFVYFLLLAFDQHVSLFGVIFFFSLADMIGLLSLLPLSLGSLDLSFIAFMTIIGVPGVIGLSVILIYRLFMNIILPLFGYGCLVSLDFLTRENLIRQ